MTEFFIILWYISLIAFIVYWRKKVKAKKQIGEFPEKYAKISKTKRLIGIASIVIFVLGGLSGSYENRNNPDPAPVAVQEQKPAVDPEQVKKDVQGFYTQFCTVDKNVKNVWNTAWVPTVEGLNKGMFNRYDGYEIMKKIKQFYAGQVLNMDEQLVIPASVTGDTRKKLENVVRDYSTAVSARRDAADKMMDLLDKGNIKPSEVEDVKFYINIASQDDAKAAAGMAEVMQSLGIEIPQSSSE